MEDSSSTTMSAVDSSTSVVGGKRTAADSAPMDVEGLAVPGYDKKRKSDDGDYDNFEDWIQDAYANLTSINLFPKIICGKLRVEKLMDSKQIERDVVLLDSFAELLMSKDRFETTKHSSATVFLAETSRLVELAKKILRDWEVIENTIPQPQLDSLSWFCMAPIDYPQAVPSAWLFERNWRDMAYEEVLNLRKKYSYLLDIAFHASMSNKVSASLALSRKKMLTYVASSREDIDYMTVETCYKWVMAIKELCILKKPSPLGPEAVFVPVLSTEKIKQPNWRDEIYEQIEACRKMYSFKLDELLRDEYNNKTELSTLEGLNNAGQKALKDSLQFLSISKTLADLNNARQKALKQYLEFLSISREGLALLSEERCRELLSGIKQFMEAEDPLAAAAAKQQQLGNSSSSLINWRDFEYGQLKVKTYYFLYHLYHVYRREKTAWSQVPGCAEDLKRLESQLQRLLEFYTMSRGEMAVFYESKEDYDNHWDVVLIEAVEECMGLVQRIVGQKEGKPHKLFFDAEKLVPNIGKFSHRLSGRGPRTRYNRSV